MDYKEKYNAALRRAKKLYGEGTITECLGWVFPELAESDSERIRKAIKSGIRHLETQLGYDAVDGVDILDIYSWLEKQGEKKPVDKVEPKFNVGDWIVLPLSIIAHIDSLNSTDYQVTTTDGKICDFKISKQDNYRLWTIKDAKDGDVLSGETDGEVFIFLFNQIQDKWIVAHGYYSEADGEFIEKAYFHRYHGNLFSPATKEQRYLLFQKMKEASYKWYSEKKELKKTVL